LQVEPTNAIAALDSWRQWHAGLTCRPSIINTLEGGRSNRNYLLDSDLGKLVLRMDAKPVLLPGGERQGEAEIWCLASAAGIAPPLLHTDEQAGFLVSAYINNGLPARPQAKPEIIENAFKLLQRCHALEVEAPRMDYAAHIESYWQLITSTGATPDRSLCTQRKPMQSLLATLLSSGTPTSLCHHDPVVANFVGNTDRLYLIDWEYASGGLQVFDYAAFGVEWELGTAEIAARSSLDAKLLDLAKTFYQYVCALWETLR